MIFSLIYFSFSLYDYFFIRCTSFMIRGGHFALFTCSHIPIILYQSTIKKNSTVEVDDAFMKDEIIFMILVRD